MNNKLTTENCNHSELISIGKNELGRWFKCTACDTTKLYQNADEKAKNMLDIAEGRVEQATDEVEEFRRIQRRNLDNAERLRKERQKANAKVMRQYRINKGKK